MRVVITAAAKADLLAIRRFIIEPHNPERAVSFVEELLDRCQALADTPGAMPWCLATSASGFATAFMAMT